MSKDKKIVSSVALNWVSMATSMAVMFFLSPFIVHHLGSIAYGVWTIVVSATNYMSLLDLGLQGAVIRYVAGDSAKGEHLDSSRTVSAALAIRFGIGLGVILVSISLGSLLPHLFHIPAELQRQARWAMVVTGTSLAISLTFGVFSAVLAGLHRFDLTSAVAMSQVVLRAIGVVYLLRAGHGILALAACELGVNVLAQAALARLSFQAYPRLRLLVELPRRDLIRKLWQYSVYAFAINIAQQVIYYTDNLLVGAFLSATAVTYYAIGGGLIEYLRQIVGKLTTTFVPLASRLEAEGKQAQLHSLLINGTRASLAVSLPIGVALFFRGHTFISLWMGPQYAQVSAQVLQILLISTVLTCGNSVSGNIAYGLGVHRPVAFWVAGEAFANVALSIVLVKKLGIYGVAWGTMIPSLFVAVVLWPRYIAQVLKISLVGYLWQSWGRSLLASIPYALACYYTDRFWQPSNIIFFFAQIAAVLPLFFIAAGLLFWNELAYRLRVRRELLASKAGAD
jgi:O-antigen/teichoic acid export membrane protein